MNKTVKILIITVISFALLIILLRLFTNNDNKIYYISLINIIANPDQFNNKHIRVIGVSRIEFENNAIYISRESYDNYLSKNGLWIEFGENYPKENIQAFKKYNGQYVVVEGIYDMKNKGHMDAFSGAIKRITRFELLIKRK